MAIKQAHRILYLSTPLGPDALTLSSFSGTEAMSCLFSYQLLMLSEKDAIDPKDIVGKNVTWKVQHKDGPERFFNGFVSRFSAGNLSGRKLRSYRAEVVPWLWFLTRTANCRIWPPGGKKKPAPDIIQLVFDDLGFKDYDVKEIKNPHPEREFCVQYRETAFNFVSRLMEEEGMYYFFRHEEGKHTLVLADQKGAYKDLPQKEVKYSWGSLADDHIDTWEHQFEFRPGKWVRTDYNFETPSTNLLTSTETIIDLPDFKKFEMFDYPGDYLVKGDGNEGTKVRMEEEEAAYEVVTGTSRCESFTPGGKFVLEDHDAENEAGKGYVITHIQHSATDVDFQSGEGQAQYRNSFQCIPDAVVFRPGQKTPKPLIAGAQTAVVVGKSEEEIYTDKYGRVKVQFFWDREGAKDQNSSCWIRVSEKWAGKNWGMVFNPRIGQEVIVEFLEGDPDRPLITGRVYNAEQMPPYEMPANQTQSGIKSRSSKGGGAEDFNEFFFEDKKGEELVYLRAQKDNTIAVENDEAHWVGRDREKTVDRDETTHIKRHRDETVDETETISIGKSRTESVGEDETISISKNRTESVGEDEKISIGGHRQEGVTKSEKVSIGEGREVGVTQDDMLKVGKTLYIEAGQKITLMTGAASIVLESNGDIQINGANITINGTGKIGVKATADVVIQGSKVLIN